MQKDEIYEDEVYLCFKPNFIWSDKMKWLLKTASMQAFELETLSFVISITPVFH